MTKSERTKYASPTEMFLDVFDEPSKLIQRQKNELLEHLKTNKEHYPLNSYEKL